jgi:hypothetical protein
MEKQRFDARIREVSAAVRQTSIARLERERDALLAQLDQGVLFSDVARRQRAQLASLNEELGRRRSRYDGLIERLKSDRKRALEYTLPRRQTLRGGLQSLPVAVEIRLPEGDSDG